MPDWVLQLMNSPIAGGVVSGMLFVGGLRVELRRLDEKARAAMSTALRVDKDLKGHITHWHRRKTDNA